jgi:hypothetical protein
MNIPHINNIGKQKTVFVMKQEKRYKMYKSKDYIEMTIGLGILSNIEPKHGWWMAEYTYDIPVPFNPACLEVRKPELTKQEITLLDNYFCDDPEKLIPVLMIPVIQKLKNMLKEFEK